MMPFFRNNIQFQELCSVYQSAFTPALSQTPNCMILGMTCCGDGTYCGFNTTCQRYPYCCPKGEKSNSKHQYQTVFITSFKMLLIKAKFYVIITSTISEDVCLMMGPSAVMMEPIVQLAIHVLMVRFVALKPIHRNVLK